MGGARIVNDWVGWGECGERIKSVWAELGDEFVEGRIRSGRRQNSKRLSGIRWMSGGDKR